MSILNSNPELDWDMRMVKYNKRKIFLAVPITPLLGEDGFYLGSAKKSIQAILSSLRDNSRQSVFCAIEREKWGQEIMSGMECTSLDLNALKESDVVLAFCDDSYGVHIELGWASSLEKPIIIMINENVGIKTPLIEGLGTITKSRIIRYVSDAVLPDKEDWEFNLKSKVLSTMEQFVDRPVPV